MAAEQQKPPTKGRARNRLFHFIKRWLIFYGILVLVLTILQRKLMYHPTVVAELSPQSEGHGDHVEPVKCTTEDGIELNGWHWKCESNDSDRPVVLFFHGNGGNRSHRTYDCQLFAQCGADTIIFDYRGYAENAGKPTEDGLHADARAAWKFTTEELGTALVRVFIVGGALGGGVATRLAADVCRAGTPPRGLMLRSTFSSMVDAASWNYWYLPVRLVLKDRYMSIEHAPDVTCPVLQVHGNVDRIVPIKSGKELFASFPDSSRTDVARTFVELDGADHNGVLITSGEEVLAATKKFFAQIAATE